MCLRERAIVTLSNSSKKSKSSVLSSASVVRSSAGNLHHFRLIKWCRPKNWLKSFLTVILLGSLIAIILYLFDIGLELVLSIILSYSLSLSGVLRTVMQIIVFILCIALIILCFLQSNKGDSVLNAFTAKNSPLFESGSVKEYGADKLITKIISVLFMVVVVLTIIEGYLG